MTALVSSQAANIEDAGFVVLGAVIKAIDDAGAAMTEGGPSLSGDGSFLFSN